MSHLCFLIAWFAATLIPVYGALIIGFYRIRAARRAERVPEQTSARFPEVEILIPVKGGFPELGAILSTFLTQQYPDYRVVFITESDDDSAVPILDELRLKFGRSVRVTAGVAEGCAQKNHNLIAGLNALAAETEIVVFCDSTNYAPEHWLKKFTRPLREDAAAVVTTFRSFRPMPENLAGLCQAVYGALVYLLAIAVPTPWGGATGIRRSLLDQLDVKRAWSDTIVDDLVLGNLLKRAGERVLMDPLNRLYSPIRNQSVRGYLDYFDRQAMFPKFTNPGIWLAMLLLYTNLVAAFFTAIACNVGAVAGYTSESYGAAGSVYLAALTVGFGCLKLTNPFPLSWGSWFGAMIPCIIFKEYVVLRSIFRPYIDWHGTRYYGGKGGKAIRIERR